MAWQVTKVKSKKLVFQKAQIAALMDLCHLKNSEVEQQFQTFRGRVVLRGDVVKDDSGSCHDVFTAQSSLASQMTAAKVLDVSATLLGCERQASDAVSAYSHGKKEDATTLLTLTKSECPDIRLLLTCTEVAKSLGKTVKNLWFLWKGLCIDTLLLDWSGRDSSRMFYKKMAGRERAKL